MSAVHHEMPRTGGRVPAVLLFIVPGLLVMVVAVVSPLDLKEGASDFQTMSVSVALGVFGVLLTALTIVLALVIDVGSRWPSLRDLVRHAVVSVWFALSFAAVVVAVVGQYRDDTTTAAVSLGVSLTGALFGLFAVYRVLSASGGHGRHDLLTGLLAGALKREDARVPEPDSFELDPYLGEFDRALGPETSDQLYWRARELDGAVGLLPPDKLPIALNLVCHLVRGTSRAALIERIPAEDAGTTLPQLMITAARATSRLVESDPDQEVLACAYLGQLARTLAWLQSAADARIDAKEGSAHAMRRLIVTTLQLRRRMSAGVHPDPPSRPEVPPLREGLVSPRAALVWMWGFIDLNGSSRGNAMYGFYAALRGERFLSAYEDPDPSLVQELAQAIAAPKSAAERESRRLLDEHGGFHACMLELTATALAVVRPLSWETPAGLGNWRDLSDEPRYAWMHARLISDQEPGEVDDALEDLAHLLGSGRGRLWGLIRQEYDRIEPAVFPELIPPSRRPAACVLACALPFAAAGEAEKLTAFARRLPDPLLRGAIGHAERRFERGPDTAEGNAVDRFVEVLTHANVR